MISLIGFLLFLGLIVFGPKKTIELAQEIGRLLAQLKNAAGHLQLSALAPGKEKQSPEPHPHPVLEVD
jgi:Sec-independent protein translocase protein TatA